MDSIYFLNVIVENFLIRDSYFLPRGLVFHEEICNLVRICHVFFEILKWAYCFNLSINRIVVVLRWSFVQMLVCFRSILCLYMHDKHHLSLSDFVDHWCDLAIFQFSFVFLNQWELVIPIYLNLFLCSFFHLDTYRRSFNYLVSNEDLIYQDRKVHSEHEVIILMNLVIHFFNFFLLIVNFFIYFECYYLLNFFIRIHHDVVISEVNHLISYHDFLILNSVYCLDLLPEFFRYWMNDHRLIHFNFYLSQPNIFIFWLYLFSKVQIIKP